MSSNDYAIAVIHLFFVNMAPGIEINIDTLRR